MPEDAPGVDVTTSLKETGFSPKELTPLERYLVIGFITSYAIFLTIIYIAGFVMGGSVGVILPLTGILFAAGISAFHADRWQLIAVGIGVLGVLPALLSIVVFVLFGAGF